ncbi:MAG: hypothetical protein IPG02_17095 [Ignavibacteria bacterium]|jgi:hypothetical protein|nr:hypothetical protein [Ignavibacteria bacterium]MBK9227245.1 hypothetical protein [Ignavibacteria bacterium]
MTEQNWPWPDELDAMIAAAKHHKLLLENEKVRVLDTCIPAGERTAVHTHKWPATYYVMSFSDFIRYDDKDNVVLDSRTLAQLPSVGTAMWSEPLVPHSLENIGAQDLRVISIEIKK